MSNQSSFAFAIALVSCTLSLAAQAPAPQPLKAMPYSPSLDVTSLDRTADPCQNFYKFTCGGWEKNNPIPADQAAWSVYAKLANDNQQFLWGVLEEDAKLTNRTPVQQKVGDYFAACMNTAAIDALGYQPVLSELGKIDALKTRAEVFAVLPSLHHEFPGNFFFGSGTGQDSIDSSTVIVELVAGGLGLPDRDYYTKTDEQSVKIREQYAAYIQQVLSLTGESAEQARPTPMQLSELKLHSPRHHSHAWSAAIHTKPITWRLCRSFQTSRHPLTGLITSRCRARRA